MASLHTHTYIMQQEVWCCRGRGWEGESMATVALWMPRTNREQGYYGSCLKLQMWSRWKAAILALLIYRLQIIKDFCLFTEVICLVGFLFCVLQEKNWYNWLLISYSMRPLGYSSKLSASKIVAGTLTAVIKCHDACVCTIGRQSNATMIYKRTGKFH